MQKIVFAALLSAAASAAMADTLTLRNGQSVQGTYLGGSAREIRMDLGDHVQSFTIDQISALQFDSGPPPAGNAPGYAPPPPSNNQGYNQAPANYPPPAYGGSAAPPAPGYNNNPPPAYGGNNPQPAYGSNPPAAGPMGITIPAGTSVTIRMVDAVDSDSSHLGRTYRASLAEPIVINGQTVIPRGADVVTKIAEDQQSGKIEGKTQIALVLQSITVNGQPVDVTSQDVTKTSSSRGERSAKVIGGTTALGAIIGAVAGGGKGAAIGAVSGAAVGTGAQIATHGQRVKIPSETRLTFSLVNPVNL
jgi:hypothetical protein